MTPALRVPGSPGAALGRWSALLVLTAALAAALSRVGVPAADLFAGLVVATAMALLGRAPRVPARLSVAAQAVLGVTIGALVQPSTLGRLGGQWVAVIAVSIGTLAISMAAGAVMGRRRGISALTGMLALTAGGASGLTAISRELGGDDRVVAVVQYLRVGIVTGTLPLVVAMASAPGPSRLASVSAPPSASASASASAAAGGSAAGVLSLLVLLLCALVGVRLGRLCRLPAAALLGPLAVTMALAVLGTEVDVTSAPLVVTAAAAYAVIGWQAGTRFTSESVRTVARSLPVAGVLILAVIVLCAGLGLILSRLTGVSPMDGYLATTPGGIYAVLAAAVSSGGDVTFVAAVQILRVVVMLAVTPYLARWLGRRFGGGTVPPH
jgi:uncharacterized protein